MSNFEKTWRAPKDVLERILSALRSGKYKQGYNSLMQQTDKGPTYCCMGVMQMELSGKVEMYRNNPTWVAGVPYKEWADSVGIVDMCAEHSKHSGYINPLLPSLSTAYSPSRISCGEVNDSRKYNFLEIADALERHCETY